MTAIRCFAVAIAFGLVLGAASRPADAYGDMYPAAEIAADAKRLETAVRKIFRIGILPSLTREERRKIGKFRIEFPRPTADSELLNFYATRHGDEGVVVMPVLSLKQLEDLTTAYAWLQTEGYSLSTIDLYFAMLRHKLVVDFPNNRFPDILTALGIPKKAHEKPGVDKLSLSLRNEAFAFILLHELGHVLYRHKPYDAVTMAQSRADELQSDSFALDVMVRTNTPPMGAVLFFQAQVYAMPHRGQFSSETAWRKYLDEASTHPLSTDRVALLANAIGGPLVAKRKSEAAIWTFIANGVRRMIPVLEEVPMQRCIQKTAEQATLEDLKPTRKTVGLEVCG